MMYFVQADHPHLKYTYTDLGGERGRKNNKVNIAEVNQYEKNKGSILISNIIRNDIT